MPLPVAHGCALRSTALASGALAALSACIGDITMPAFDSRLDAIEVSGLPSVAVGHFVCIAATGHVSGILGMLYYDPLPDAVWTVSDSTLGGADPIETAPGDTAAAAWAEIQGLHAGYVTVTVTARGVSGSHPVLVTAGVARATDRPDAGTSGALRPARAPQHLGFSAPDQPSPGGTASPSGCRPRGGPSP